MSEAIDFQPYLRSIRDTYQKRNRLHTPTDAEFERSREMAIDFRNSIGRDDPLLLFEQMAEIVPSRKQVLESQQFPIAV